MNKLTFNPDKYQKAFLDAFNENLNIFKNNFMILNGDAGPGKTELILELKDICNTNLIAVETTAFTGRVLQFFKIEGLKMLIQ